MADQLDIKISAATGAGDGVEQMPVRYEEDDVIRAILQPVHQHKVGIQLPVRNDAAQFAESF